MYVMYVFCTSVNKGKVGAVVLIHQYSVPKIDLLGAKGHVLSSHAIYRHRLTVM